MIKSQFSGTYFRPNLVSVTPKTHVVFVLLLRSHCAETVAELSPVYIPVKYPQWRSYTVPPSAAIVKYQWLLKSGFSYLP
jgi:hypothetical protein